MIDLTNVQHHPVITEIVEVLCAKTQNTDGGFFRAELAYFLCKMAGCMRATVVTKDRGSIPINMYVLALANSGFGKGHSVGIMENEFIKGFKQRFTEETINIIAEKNLWKIATDRSIRNGGDLQEEYDKTLAEYNRAGTYPFTFDSGSPEGIRQIRHKLLLANAGSINLQIDEIGSKLIGSTDILNVYLELYDQGSIKQKLIKNTNDNKRNEDIDGKTPTNALLFGTPVKLLDGGQTEDQLYSFLETGYARRCLFGYGQQDRKAFHNQTATEIYQTLIQPNNTTLTDKWADHFYQLADPAMFDWQIRVEDDVAIQLLEYKIACEKAADLMADHEEIKKAELSHRYFKALKLAGAFAFVDKSSIVAMDHLMQSILLVEESGRAFQIILNREKSYVKLAKYIASLDNEVTHADLLEALPFYKSGNAARNELMTLAMAWGYKKHIIIKKSFVDGIEFFKGETLKETDLNQMKISYSDHWAYNYLGEQVPFDQLHNLTQAPSMHWANHFFKNGHRSEETVNVGFNLLVIDIDEGVSVEAACELMKEYKYLIYTTKRHTDEANRFRMIFPINYILELDSEEYKEFMNNVMGWLPFKIDESANQRSRKWETFDGGNYVYNMEGEILDALPFIPKTSKNESYRQQFQKVESLDNLERWFALRFASGNRNNQMIKFALALVDNGHSIIEVNKMVHAFNEKMNNPLTKDEIDSTVLKSVAKRFQKN
jgi:hypothetical protein